jgi:endo-beta-N-acetylglucosaminidase D
MYRGLAITTLAATLALTAPVGAAEAKLMLSVADVLGWVPPADAGNISTVPLARRFSDPAAEPDRAGRFDPAARVMLAPDGMDNLGAASDGSFNRYVFSHWPQVDILAWFAGNAAAPLAIPSRPWVEAAHRHGVKVIGTLFFAPVAWGGGPETLESFLVQDAQGRFPAADRMVEIARHYRFDGWFINQETGLNEVKGPDGKVVRGPTSPQAAALAAKVLAFMRYLTAIAPADQEIHWYDAMLPDNGAVGWQNALNRRNLPFLQDGAAATADGMFLNYWWTGDGLRQGAALAESVGRSRYDLFIGADLWPARKEQPAFRNDHWLRDLRGADGKALGSIGLFAPNFNFNFDGDEKAPAFSRFASDARDVGRFYAAEQRLFAGDDGNMAVTDRAGWDGISALVPARSSVTSLPFATSFSTGHGRLRAEAGRVVGGAWHDMGAQDVLPTWQFAWTPGAALDIGFDFDRAYQGGNALRAVLSKPFSGKVEIPLYLLDLPAHGALSVRVAADAAGPGAALRLTLADGGQVDFPLEQGNGWRMRAWCVADQGTLRRLSLVLPGAAGQTVTLGRVVMEEGCGVGEERRARE